MKITNNLLAAVLILTVVPPHVGLSEPALEHCCFLISQKLLDKEVSIVGGTAKQDSIHFSPQVSLTAAHCAKTLVFAATSGNRILNHCIKLLLPGLIEYIASVAALTSEQAAQDTQIKGTDEILKAFGSFFTSTPEEFRESFPLSPRLDMLTTLSLTRSARARRAPTHDRFAAEPIEDGAVSNSFACSHSTTIIRHDGARGVQGGNGQDGCCCKGDA